MFDGASLGLPSSMNSDHLKIEWNSWIRWKHDRVHLSRGNERIISGATRVVRDAADEAAHPSPFFSLQRTRSSSTGTHTSRHVFVIQSKCGLDPSTCSTERTIEFSLKISRLLLDHIKSSTAKVHQTALLLTSCFHWMAHFYLRVKTTKCRN